VRSCAAIPADEFLGSLPFVIAVSAIDLITRTLRDRSRITLPDGVIDGISGCPWDLRVSPFREKSNWRYPLTVFYQGKFY
jgi:hypothetical protein